MALNYKAITWTKHKKSYDLVLLGLIVLFFVIFGGVHFSKHPQVQPQIFIIRSTAFLSFILLHIILWIGPLARINKNFLILLYNRRHLGVVMFLFAFIHGLVSIIYFHGFGNENPILSVFLSNLQYTTLAQFPFQVLGFGALVVFFLMAATSHDFWLHNLSPRIWKSLHMLVYLAYLLVVLHILLGYFQSNGNIQTELVFAISVGLTLILHLIAAVLGKWKSQKGTDAYIAIENFNSIEDCRAKIINVQGKSIAVFRFGNFFSAIENKCKHQQGPLGEGKIIDGCITCPWHGYQYQTQDGCSPPPYEEKVHTYPLKIENDQLYLGLQAYPLGQQNDPVEFHIEQVNSSDRAFFIGWSDSLSKGYKTKVFAMVFGLTLFVAGLAFIFANTQENYKESAYTFGKLEEFEGIYIDDKAPMMQVTNEGKPIDIMLVDFGKFSSKRSISIYEERNKVKLNGKKIKIRGTKISYNNQMLIELAEREDAILGVYEDVEYLSNTSQIVENSLRGEIVDPKCFFGVMNPAEGKIHKSCAIRCIAGGIPAILRKKSDNGENYYIIIGDQGQYINKKLLPYIGEDVLIKGKITRINNWNYIELDSKSEIQRLTFRRFLKDDSVDKLCSL
jgi:DMSO/TMAO reductase YedYZ heme-binding membrane subunit